MDKLLLSRKEAAEVLSISTRKLDALTAAGQIAVTRIGRRPLYSIPELQRYRDQNSVRKQQGQWVRA